MGFLYTVAVVVLVAIIAYLIFRLLRQKVPKPKESVKNRKQEKRSLAETLAMFGSILFVLGFLIVFFTWEPFGAYVCIIGFILLITSLIMFIVRHIRSKSQSKYL